MSQAPRLGLAEAPQDVAGKRGRERLVLERGVGDDADQGALERPHAAGHEVGRALRAPRRRRRLRRAGRASAGWRGGRRAPGRRARRRGRSGSARLGGPRGRAARRGCDRRSARSGGRTPTRALKVWKNSSRVRSRPVRNWTSSMSSTSALRKRSLNSAVSAVADGVDERGREVLAGGVADLEAAAVALDVVADRVQEMGLAEAGSAVEEERVVGLRGQLGDGEGGGVGEAVALADHELVEGVARVELVLRASGPAGALGAEDGSAAVLRLASSRARRSRPSHARARRRPRARRSSGR